MSAPWRTLAEALRGDRVAMWLVLVLVAGSAFYLWTAASSVPLSLAGDQGDYYNKLAKAVLHLHLAVGLAPSGLVHLANPYDPVQNAPYQTAYHDLSLYHGRLYMEWGPSPLLLLIPLHVLGLGASTSLVVALFGIAGLAFALATLRLLIREFDAVPLWMGVLAAAVLVCSTTLPFLLRRPVFYEEAIASGYCFAMAGLFIAVRTLVNRSASLGAIALMSLCFGLAASRPPLLAIALLLVPVYLALADVVPGRSLLVALLGPLGLCLTLLLAYNVARFGSPLEFGQSYQLAGYDPHKMHFGKLSYTPPNLWFYGFSPPRPTILFPFLALTPPPITYPFAKVGPPELTGGLLTMTPLLVFALALPWMWRRRPNSIGRLAVPLLSAVLAGILALLFLSYEFPNSTERYETDFAVLFLFAAIAAWFALSTGRPGRRRRVVRTVGAMFAVWGCLTGVAISFTGYQGLLEKEHPGSWSSLENATSLISTAMAAVAGHPVLAKVEAPKLVQLSPVTLTSIGAGVQSFWLPGAGAAQLTIVSPDRRQAAIVARMSPGAAVPPRAVVSVRLGGGSSPVSEYPLRGGGLVRLPVSLKKGLNRVQLVALPSALAPPSPRVPAGQALVVSSLTLAGRY